MFGSALKILIQMIGIIQIVNHIPLMNIDVPSNAVSFYKAIIPVVNYDMLSNFDFYEDFLTRISRSKSSNSVPGRMLEELLEDKPIPYQIQYLGYENRNPMANLGTITAVLF